MLSLSLEAIKPRVASVALSLCLLLLLLLLPGGIMCCVLIQEFATTLGAACWPLLSSYQLVMTSQSSQLITAAAV